MNSLQKNIFLFLLIFCITFLINSLQAQNPVQQRQFGTGNIYDKNRNKKPGEVDRSYNLYDIEKFIEEQKKVQQQEMLDSANYSSKLKVTPEELRKLGVSEAVIQQLLQLNSKQDSIGEIKKQVDYQRQMQDILKGRKKPDTLSLTDIQTLIEFQKDELVKKALALPEPIMYGQEFFRRNNLNMFEKMPSSAMKRTPDNYVLGEGDQITIAMWGNIDYNQAYIIDQTGSINPPLVGRIYLQGMTYEKCKEFIKQRFSKKYDLKKSNIDVVVSYNRLITAHFVGELLNPGSYQIPALTSIFNVLVAISGPNQLGSVRAIEVRRDGKTLATLDVYQYLLNPNTQNDFFLENNDYVIVHAVGKVVNIAGEIKRPHNYELKENEGIIQLLDYAGGLKPEAFTQTLNIKRYRNNKEIIIDLKLDSLQQRNANFKLEAGDSITVYRVPLGPRNYVHVIGAAKVPGKYELKPNEKISDILLRASGTKENADPTRAYVMRLKPDLTKQIIAFNLQDILNDKNNPKNIALQNLDTIQIISREDFRQNFEISVYGSVQKPGNYEYAEGLTLKDVLYLVGGLKKEAANNRIEVSRVINFFNEKENNTTQTIPNTADRVVIKQAEVRSDLTLDKNSELFEIKPYDHIFIRISPNFEEQQIVKIYGEVMYPGEYALLSKEEPVTSLIERAGGFTKYAFQEAAQMYREQDSLGYVMLDMNAVMKDKNKSGFNYVLTRGDSLYIPTVKNLVTMRGALGHFEADSILQISVPFVGIKSAQYYVNNYGGGFSRYARRAGTYVQQPNGRVEKTRTALWVFHKYPKVQKGSTIFIDLSDRKKNEDARRKSRDKRSWNDAFDSFTSKVATILTLAVLVYQIK